MHTCLIKISLSLCFDFICVPKVLRVTFSWRTASPYENAETICFGIQNIFETNFRMYWSLCGYYWSLILRVTLMNLLSKLILIMNYNRVLGRLGSLKVSFLCQWDHILTLMSNAGSSTLIPFWSWDLINNLMNMEGPSKNEDWWHRPKKKHQ